MPDRPATPSLGDSALAGVRVLELADEKGVYCGKLLADMGADVIKVEPPGGDRTRRIAPFRADRPDPDGSLFFLYNNTSKRSVTLDITHPDGQDLFRSLARSASLVIETLPPGTLDDLGLGYRALMRENPRLVMTSITGFGQTGPYRNFRSSDLVASALGGALYVTGEEEDPPVTLAGSQAYKMASAFGAVSSLIAVYHAEAEGAGQHVDISAEETTAAITHVCGAGKWLDDGIIPKRMGAGLFSSVPSGTYACQDGLVYLMVNRPLHWNALAKWIHEVTGNEVVLEPLFLGPSSNRQPYRDIVDEAITDLTRRHTVEEIYHEGQRRHIAFTPMNGPADVVADRHLAAREYFVDVRHDDGRHIRYPGAPYRHSETPWQIYRHAPRVGEHNDEIYLRELGLSENEYRAMEDTGVVALESAAATNGARPHHTVTAPGTALADADQTTKTGNETVERIPLSVIPAKSLPPRKRGAGIWKPSGDMDSRVRGNDSLGHDQPLPPMRNTGALAGLRVVEFTAGMAGPWIGRIMAYCGADVIKVESMSRPDVTRLYVPPRNPELGVQSQLSPWFTDWNAGKRFVTLDLTNPQAVELARRLVATADVVVENYAAGVMEKLGLGRAEIQRANPQVISFSTSGYGDSGPYKRYVTWGPNIEALSGLGKLSGFPGRPCAITQYAYPDPLSALHGLVAVLCAVLHRRRTGRGQAIGQSQFEATVGTVGEVFLEYLANGAVPPQIGNRSRFVAPQGCYRCRDEDRWCAVSVGEADWQRFCEVARHPEWAAEPRFRSVELRMEHADELDQLISQWTAERDAYDVMNTLQAAGIAAGVVQNIEDQYRHDPQLAARGFFEEIAHAKKGSVVANGLALGLTGTPGHTPHTGRAPGHDNQQVFGELLGMTDEEIRHCVESGAIEA